MLRQGEVDGISGASESLSGGGEVCQVLRRGGKALGGCHGQGKGAPIDPDDTFAFTTTHSLAKAAAD